MLNHNGECAADGILSKEVSDSFESVPFSYPGFSYLLFPSEEITFFFFLQVTIKKDKFITDRKQ